MKRWAWGGRPLLCAPQAGGGRVAEPPGSRFSPARDARSISNHSETAVVGEADRPAVRADGARDELARRAARPRRGGPARASLDRAGARAVGSGPPRPIRWRHGARGEAGGRRPRVELVPAGRVHGRRWLVASHRRDLRAGPIGEGLAASGGLGEPPISRALATLEVFAHFCRASGLDEQHVDAVATSAIREAGNAEAFLAPARERSRDAIRVLSRGRRPTTPTSLRSTPPRSSRAACWTSGAARCSCCGSRSRLPRQCGSWRVGTVLMSERFLPANGRRRSASSWMSCASTSPRSSRGRAGWSGSAARAPAPGGARGHGAQPRRRRPAGRGPAVHRRAGDGDRARRPG